MRIFILSVLALATASCLAEEPGKKQALDEAIKSAVVDMPITTAPAAFLIGASGEKVLRAQSFRPFAAGVARAYNERGELANAVAAEIAPALAMQRYTWDDIVANPVSRVLARTTVSFATRVGKNTEGDQTAIGVQSILYSKEMDEVIKLASAPECLTSLNDSVMDRTRPTAPGSKLELSPETIEKISKCQDKIAGKLNKWNQTMFAMGFGRSVRSEQRTEQKKYDDTSGVWLTASIGGDVDHAESIPEDTKIGYGLTFHVRKMFKELVKDDADKDVQSDRLIRGVNLRYGNGILAGILEYSYTTSKSAGISNSRRALLGLEYRITNDVYLTLASTRDSGRNDQTSMLANLKFAIGKSSAIFPQ
jgi:hypothetical protein